MIQAENEISDEVVRLSVEEKSLLPECLCECVLVSSRPAFHWSVKASGSVHSLTGR